MGIVHILPSLTGLHVGDIESIELTESLPLLNSGEIGDSGDCISSRASGENTWLSRRVGRRLYNHGKLGNIALLP